MIGSTKWGVPPLVFVLPAVLAVVCLLVASGLQREWARLTARGVGSLLILGVILLAGELCSYYWALHLESKWSAAKPTTRVQLESFLSLYSQREIQPSQSDWGRDYQLKPGERMIQYMLLYRAPLDVVYTTNDTIAAIYTSYE
jgi:uncharacterized membrane protein